MNCTALQGGDENSPNMALTIKVQTRKILYRIIELGT